MRLKYHEAGMDLGLSTDPIQSFRLFQAKVLEVYDQVTDEYGLTVIDGKRNVVEQQREVRKLVKPILKGLRRTGVVSRPARAVAAEA